MARPATAAVRLLTSAREPVRLCATSNIDVDTGGLVTVDGVQTVAGDRILLTGQTDGSENGIRDASAGQWYRSADSRTARTMQKGTTVYVQEGTINAGKTYTFNTLDPVIGDTGLDITADPIPLTPLDILDEDDMASNSATKVPSQQSVNVAKLQKVATRTAMKVLSVTVHSVVYLTEGGREGIFYLQAGSPPYADPSEGVFVVSNTAGFYWERKETQLNPAMFGASLDPSVDSGPAIQACFDFIALTYSYVAGGYIYSYHDPRFYGTSQAINNINRQQPGWKAGTIALVGRCTGKIVFECGGLNVGTISELNIYGDRTNMPALGAYTGRMKVGGVVNAASNMKIKGGRIAGYFSKAAFVQFAAEVSDVHLSIENSAKAVGGLGYVNAGHWGTIDDYLGGLVSDFGTFPAAADGSQSNILHKIDIPGVTRGHDVYLTVTGITKANPGVVSINSAALTASGLVNGDKIFGGEILGMVELQPGATNPSGVYTIANINLGAGTFELQGINTTGYSTFTSGHVRNQTGVAVLLNGLAGATWDNFYTLSYGNPGIVFDTKNGIAMRDVFLGFSMEPSGQYPVRIDLPSAGQIEIPSLQLDMLNQFQTFSDCLIQTNGAGGNVKLTDFRLAVRMLSNTPPNKIFGTPAKVTLNNFDIRVPAAAVFNDFSAAGGWNAGSVPTGIAKASDVGTLQFFGTIVEFRVNGSGVSSARAYSSLAGANEGPTFTTLRAGGAGVANDALGVYDFRGQDAANAEVRYGYLRGRILVATAGAATGRVEMVTIGGGADAIAGYWQQDLINATAKFTVAGTQVVGPRATGWTAGTGTALKGAWAAYAGQTHTGAYVQATIQALDDNCKNTSQRVKALEDMLRTHGLMN